MFSKIPSFTDLTKIPISVIALMAIITLTYLYNEEIKLLRKDLSDLQDKFIEVVAVQKPK